jgi:hypothetical protein
MAKSAAAESQHRSRSGLPMESNQNSNFQCRVGGFVAVTIKFTVFLDVNHLVW